MSNGGKKEKLIGGKRLADLTDEERKEAIESGEIEVPEPTEMNAESLFNFDRLGDFIVGDMTWAQLVGLTVDEAYEIAEHGFSFFQEGRYHDARVIFEALALANPYDPYFRTMNGAVYQQLEMTAEAVVEYSAAISLDSSHLHAYVNRGELLMENGEFKQALEDLKRAVELDPDATEEAGQRAKDLLEGIENATESLKKEKKEDETL